MKLVHPPTKNKIHLVNLNTELDDIVLDTKRTNIFLMCGVYEETAKHLNDKILSKFGKGTKVELDTE